MASFILTKEVVTSLFDPTAKGDWAPFLAAIDPEVRWVINDEVENKRSMTGVYNLARWQTDVAAPLWPKLTAEPYCLTMKEFHLLGPTSVVLEAGGKAVQKNGNRYDNQFAWFLIFSPETGKIVEIREYMNTALLQEVLETNP